MNLHFFFRVRFFTKDFHAKEAFAFWLDDGEELGTDVDLLVSGVFGDVLVCEIDIIEFF